MRARKSATGSVKLMLSPSSSVRSGLYIGQGQRTSEDGLAGHARHIPAHLKISPGFYQDDFTTTTMTSQLLESHPGARDRGSTNGIPRTCAERRAGGRRACSGYACARKTLASWRP